MAKHPLVLVIALIILSLMADLAWRTHARLFRCPLVKASFEESPLEEDLVKAAARLAQWKIIGQAVDAASLRLSQSTGAQGYRLHSDDLLWPVWETEPNQAPLILSVSDVAAGALVESTLERFIAAEGTRVRPLAVAIRFGKSQAASWPAKSAVIEVTVSKTAGPITLNGEFHSRGLVDAVANGLSRYCQFPLTCMKATLNGNRTDFQLATLAIPLDETPQTLSRVSAALGKTIALLAKGKTAPNSYLALSLSY